MSPITTTEEPSPEKFKNFTNLIGLDAVIYMNIKCESELGQKVQKPEYKYCQDLKFTSNITKCLGEDVQMRSTSSQVKQNRSEPALTTNQLCGLGQYLIFLCLPQFLQL